MRFYGITGTSMTNGDGLRTVLWVAGCNHHCKGCQNEYTWDPEGGDLFTEEIEKEIFRTIDRDFWSGLTLSGGDPMYPSNRKDILDFCRKFNERYCGSRTIWMYTGYTMEQIKDEPILDEINVLVDGPYIEERRNVNRQWCGSENQRVWRKINGIWKADKPAYSYDNEIQTHGCEDD